MLRLKSNRYIKAISIHHTWRPNYDNWRQHPSSKFWNDSMRTTHIRDRGFSDIGQHFTVFPNGEILAGRDIDKTPAVIKNFNANTIGVEILGDFNIGCDTITDEQFRSFINLIVALHRENGLRSCSIVYHHWKDKSKTCPGTGFLNFGNKEGIEKLFLEPLINKLLRYDTSK